MKFWTVQSKNVMEIVRHEGLYLPDFNRSLYLNKENPGALELYYLILDSFNRQNNLKLKGLSFSFAQSYKDSIYPIPNFEDFILFIHEHKNAIGSLWKQLCKNDVEILELEYQNNFNPIFIDINDFQYLMPPVIFDLPPYNKFFFDMIVSDLKDGICRESIFPSNVIQAHLPYIATENVINVYNMFEV